MIRFLSKKTMNSRIKISAYSSQKQHGQSRQGLDAKKGDKSPMASYSLPKPSKLRKNRKKKHTHTKKDLRRGMSAPSASRGKKKLPVVYNGRHHVRFKRVLLDVSSMPELYAWIKHHRNPGGFVCLELARNPKCGFENVYFLAIAFRMRMRLRDTLRANLNKNYFILTKQNLTYYEGKTGEVLEHWSVREWMQEKLRFEDIVYGLRSTNPRSHGRTGSKYLRGRRNGRYESLAQSLMKCHCIRYWSYRVKHLKFKKAVSYLRRWTLFSMSPELRKTLMKCRTIIYQNIACISLHTHANRRTYASPSAFLADQVRHHKVVTNKVASVIHEVLNLVADSCHKFVYKEGRHHDDLASILVQSTRERLTPSQIKLLQARSKKRMNRSRALSSPKHTLPTSKQIELIKEISLVARKPNKKRMLAREDQSLRRIRRLLQLVLLIRFLIAGAIYRVGQNSASSLVEAIVGLPLNSAHNADMSSKDQDKDERKEKQEDKDVDKVHELYEHSSGPGNNKSLKSLQQPSAVEQEDWVLLEHSQVPPGLKEAMAAARQKRSHDKQSLDKDDGSAPKSTTDAAIIDPSYLDEAKLVPRFSSLRVDIIERACISTGGLRHSAFHDFILELREMAEDPGTASSHARIRYFEDRRATQRQRAKALKPNMLLSPVCCITPDRKMHIQCLFTADQWCTAVSELLATYSRFATSQMHLIRHRRINNILGPFKSPFDLYFTERRRILERDAVVKSSSPLASPCRFPSELNDITQFIQVSFREAIGHVREETKMMVVQRSASGTASEAWAKACAGSGCSEHIINKRRVEVENNAIDAFLEKTKEVNFAIINIVAIGTRAVAYGSLLMDRKWVACSLIHLNLERLAALSKNARQRFDCLGKDILDCLEDIKSRLGPGAEVSDVFGSLRQVDSAICSLKAWQEALQEYAIKSFAVQSELKSEVIHVTNTREKVEKLIL